MALRAGASPTKPSHPARGPMVPGPATQRGRVLVAKERCKGCELCIEFCPKDVLAKSDGYNAKGYHYPFVKNDVCINCRLCVTICPEFAIFSVPVNARPREPSSLGGRA